MNFLAIAQLAATAFQVIGKATHPQFNNDFINEVKSGLDSLAKICQQQHDSQQLEQQTEDQKLKQQSEEKTNAVS
jgi:hypothetical protein